MGPLVAGVGRAERGQKAFETGPRCGSAPAKAPPRPVGSSFNGIESVPVRLDLIADQRHLTTLFAELANAPLQVEVSGFSANYRPRRRADSKQGDPRKGQNADTGPLYTIVDSYDVQVSIEGKINFYKDPEKHLPSGP